MDAHRFDDVIRAFSSTATRRRFLVGLAALPFFAADDEARAWERKRRGKNAKKAKKGKKAKDKKNPKDCAGKECGGKCGDCRDGKVCHDGVCGCPDAMAECDGRCVNLLTDADHCGACNASCPGSNGCRHGTCTCDPFNNTCPLDETPFKPGDLCGCGAVVANQFVAACVDGNSACDMDKPCFSDDDCQARSVCLRGCSDPPTPPDPNHNPNRCSKPCN